MRWDTTCTGTAAGGNIQRLLEVPVGGNSARGNDGFADMLGDMKSSSPQPDKSAPEGRLSRRDLLTTAIFLAAAGPVSGRSAPEADRSSDTTRMPIPDHGWRLWLDEEATWAGDTIYLPDEVRLENLPTRSPTGGWGVLDADRGLEVSLPSTVEAHYWGTTRQGLRPYTKREYMWAHAKSQVRNGAYFGVSWWWREILIPPAMKKHKLLLSIRGARQRAEVYLNHQLVGYDIIEETAFECDITRAVRWGKPNQLAIRITNPGGRFDWMDDHILEWGGIPIQRSHGFGGLDRGISLRACDAAYIEDLWVLNTPDPHTINAFVDIRNESEHNLNGQIRWIVRCLADGKPVFATVSAVEVPSRSRRECSVRISCNEAELWDIDHPVLHAVKAEFSARMTGAGICRDEAERAFGFRWINAEGIGRRARLMLNGRRIRLYSAISWGYWGINGLWPLPELAHKEVTAARELGLNCLNFHRNFGKEEVLEIQDRLGLLRYMEPGGGALAAGIFNSLRPAFKTSRLRSILAAPVKREFLIRYESEKLRRMVKQFRSHPSTFAYYLQDEWLPEFCPLRAAELLRELRRLDPSRVIVAKDGISPRGEAWFRGADRQLMQESTGRPSGWWCQHTVGSSHGVWQDWMYRNPSDYMYRSTRHGQIVEWGEMDGGASTDNSSRMLKQIAALGGKSYDLLDHQQLNEAYGAFIRRWNFHTAFPNTGVLFEAIGKRQYQFWFNLLENARLSDANDFIVISGWESTAIEDHSGLVDNLRNHKAPPTIIRQKLLPVLPIAKPRHSVVALGRSVVLDLYMVNELPTVVTGKLILACQRPDDRIETWSEFSIPAWRRDQFYYSVHTGVRSPPLEFPGWYQISLQVQGHGDYVGRHDVLAVGLPARDAHVPTPVVSILADGSLRRDIQSLHRTGYIRGGKGLDSQVIVLTGRGRPQDAGNRDVKFAAHATGRVSPIGSAVMDAVRRGAHLLVWTSDDRYAAAVTGELAAQGLLSFHGLVGRCRASWMGSWIFIRQHPLFESLPHNCAMDGYYQVGTPRSNGLMIDGETVEVMAGYGRDHDRNIGAAIFSLPCGAGSITLVLLPGLNPIIRRRMLVNAINWLASGGPHPR